MRGIDAVFGGPVSGLSCKGYEVQVRQKMAAATVSRGLLDGVMRVLEIAVLCKTIKRGGKGVAMRNGHFLLRPALGIEMGGASDGNNRRAAHWAVVSQLIIKIS